MGSVRLDDETQKGLVEKLAKAVTEATQLTTLEVHRQYARAEAELAQARQALTHRDQTIAGLEARVQQLSGIITTISQGAGGAFPIPTTQAIPAFQDRYAASAPLPPLTVAPWNNNGAQTNLLAETPTQVVPGS